MIKFFRRLWDYLTAGANQKFNEKADPKIQLEQAITEAQDQHRRLKEQAANVIAQQKQTEMRLNRPARAAREAQRQRPPGRADGRRGHQEGRRRQGRPSTPGPPRPSPPSSSPSRARSRSSRTHALQRHPGLRPGQGRGRPERPAPPAEAGRAPEAPRPARAGEDAGADEQGDGLAVGDRRRGRPHPQRGAGQDRGRATPRPRAWPSCSETSVEGRMLEIEQAAQNIEAQARLDRDPRPARHRDRRPPRRRRSAPAAPEAAEPPPPSRPTEPRRPSPGA